jgi:hypothetical protein
MDSIKNMPSNARVWVYQSNRELNAAEVNSIAEEGLKFISDWSAHGAELKASFDVLNDRFIIVAVDEEQAMASGCSIDKSVSFMKQLEKKFDLNLFDRMQVAYKDMENIMACSLSDFEKLAKEGRVNENTIVFNNMITTKSGFDSEWEIPLGRSWQSRVLK